MSKAVKQKVSDTIVISIKPNYVDLIMSGRKTVELRRRFSESLQGTTVFIYSSSPVKGIVGKTVIKKIVKRNIEDLWLEVGKFSGVSYNYFKTYFDGLEVGYGILLEKPQMYEKHFSLEQLSEKASFSPPQSYMFAYDSLITLLESQCLKISLSS